MARVRAPRAHDEAMTYWMLAGVWAGAMVVGTVLFFFVLVPAQERRAAARARFEDDPHAAAVRDVIWRATVDPAECPHDDVLEEPRLAPIRGWDESSFAAPQSSIVNQAGVCRKCGASVIRHGRPPAWTEWMFDPTVARDDDEVSGV